MANIAMKAFPPPINIPPVSKAPCSVGQSTGKGKNSFSHERG